MSRVRALVKDVKKSLDRDDRPYWGAAIEMIAPATGEAFVSIPEIPGADPLSLKGAIVLIDGYGPGAPLLTFVGVETNEPPYRPPVSDLELFKGMLVRAAINFREVPVDQPGDTRVDVVEGAYTTYFYFKGRDLDLHNIVPCRTGHPGWKESD